MKAQTVRPDDEQSAAQSFEPYLPGIASFTDSSVERISKRLLRTRGPIPGDSYRQSE